MDGIADAKDEEEMNRNIEKLYKSNVFLTKENLRNYLQVYWLQHIDVSIFIMYYTFSWVESLNFLVMYLHDLVIPSLETPLRLLKLSYRL